MPIFAGETAAFRDAVPRGLAYSSMGGIAAVESGDPGAYDPQNGSAISARASFSHNKMSQPFGSKSARDLQVDIFGQDAPGPGTYSPAQAQAYLLPDLSSVRSAFASSSQQRPMADHAAVPGPEVYSPNRGSITPKIRDSGASMRSASARFVRADHPDSMCSTKSTSEETVGPGLYDSHEHGTIAQKSARSLERASKLKPAFGSISSARKLPHAKPVAPGPGPGAYQPEIWTGIPVKRRPQSQERNTARAGEKGTSRESSRVASKEQPAPRGQSTTTPILQGTP